MTSSTSRLTRRQPTAPTPAISGNSTATTPRETGRTELIGDDFPTFRWRHDARVKLTGAPHPIIPRSADPTMFSSQVTRERET
jgi:hypothetical protein